MGWGELEGFVTENMNKNGLSKKNPKKGVQYSVSPQQFSGRTWGEAFFLFGATLAALALSDNPQLTQQSQQMLLMPVH